MVMIVYGVIESSIHSPYRNVLLIVIDLIVILLPIIRPIDMGYVYSYPRVKGARYLTSLGVAIQ